MGMSPSGGEEIKMVTLHTATLDGKQIAFSSETEFLVQVGKGKGAYKTRYRFVGNIGQAVGYYRGINSGNGYKKRLVSWAMNKPVLAREVS
jgi:hypothetical protein